MEVARFGAVEPVSQIDTTRTLKATPAEQQSAERPSTVQATAGQPAADKPMAPKPDPEQFAEPVRVPGELPLIWLPAAAILIAVVSVVAATTYLPHERAVASISVPAFAPIPGVAILSHRNMAQAHLYHRARLQGSVRSRVSKPQPKLKPF